MIHDWLYMNNEVQWLLVIDDLDEFLADQYVSELLQSCIPRTLHVTVLVITRSQDTALQLVERQNMIIVNSLRSITQSITQGSVTDHVIRTYCIVYLIAAILKFILPIPKLHGLAHKVFTVPFFLNLPIMVIFSVIFLAVWFWYTEPKKPKSMSWSDKPESKVSGNDNKPEPGSRGKRASKITKSLTGHDHPDEAVTTYSGPQRDEITETTSASNNSASLNSKALDGANSSELPAQQVEEDNTDSLVRSDKIQKKTSDDQEEITRGFVWALCHGMPKVDAFTHETDTLFRRKFEMELETFYFSVVTYPSWHMAKSRQKRIVMQTIYRRKVQISGELGEMVKNKCDARGYFPRGGTELVDNKLEWASTGVSIKAFNTSSAYLESSLLEALISITNHPGFVRLVQTTKQLIRHYCFDTMKQIQYSLSKLQDRASSSLDDFRHIYQVRFDVHWDLPLFIKERKLCGMTDELGSVLTITGNSRKAQMSTVAQFIRQTWGTQFQVLLPVIQTKISGQRGEEICPIDYSCFSRLVQNPDLSLIVPRHGRQHPSIEIALVRNKVIASVTGSKDFVIAIGQQLAWLGATCRPRSKQPQYGRRYSLYCDTFWRRHHTLSNSYAIWYDTVEVDVEAAEDDYWKNNFLDFCIASGYSIIERPRDEIGLQLPARLWKVVEDFPENLLLPAKLPSGLTTDVYIREGPSYYLKKKLSHSEHKMTLAALEKHLTIILHSCATLSFQEALMEILRGYQTSNSEGDVFYFSGNLHRIIAELLDIDPSSIEWTRDEKPSLGDIIKDRIEHSTKEQLNWWPFNPPRRINCYNGARLYWRCVSNHSRTTVGQSSC